MTHKHSDVKAQFAREGVSISDWAKAHGFERKLVYKVLNGDVKAIRGEAHRIAIALGLKEEPRQKRLAA